MATIVEAKQHWSVRWVTKNLLSRAAPCFGRHVKPLVPAVCEVYSNHYFSLVIHKGGLYPSSGTDDDQYPNHL
jgi:hypothetical protein